MTRYSRQELFAGIGREGQRRIRASRVLVVGCGALGSTLAEIMARAGVGRLTVVDRDFLELSNLQRQSLFDEQDVAQGLPKAVAAERRLRAINSEVEVRGLVTDLSAETEGEIIRDVDLVLDGTDNFETRYLVNDVCVREGIPWVYGACVASYGLVLAIRPRLSPCLRCVLEEMPPAGSGPTCDMAGVIAPIVHVVAGLQAGEGLKLLAGHPERLLAGLLTVDLWQGVFETLDLSDRPPHCPTCVEGRFDYAAAGASGTTTVLCGRDAVQIRPARGAVIDLTELAARLSPLGQVTANPYLVRFACPEGELVVFGDGRAIVKGVHDAAAARSIYARYVGI